MENPRRILLQDKSGGWAHHDGKTANVEALILRVYDAIRIKAATLAGSQGKDPVGFVDAALLLPRKLTHRHLQALARRLDALAAEDAERVRFLAADQFDGLTPPVLPLERTGAINVQTGVEMGATEYARMHRRHVERGAVRYNPNADAPELAGNLLHSHFPEDWVSLASYHIAWPGDDLLAFISGPQGTGKTCFWEWTARATGSVSIMDAGIVTDRAQYTAVEEALTQNRTVMLDEADRSKGKPIRPGRLNMLTSERFNLNPKMKAPQPNVRRLGAAVVVGNGWPDIDTSVAGLQRRARWAWDEPLPSLDGAVRDAVLNDPAAAEYLLRVLVERAQVFANLDRDNARRELVTPEVRAALARFMADGRPEFANALADHVAKGSPGDYVTAARIQGIIEAVDGRKPSNQDVGRVPAGLGARSGSTTIDGKKARVWYGIRDSFPGMEEQHAEMDEWTG